MSIVNIKLIKSVLFMAVMQACKHPCVPNDISPVFIGFPPGDVDTFVIRSYAPNSNFSSLVDTVLIIKNITAVYTESNDTVIAFLNLDPPLRPIRSGYDWQIYIPKQNRTITLTNIVDVPREGNAKVCYDYISSFELNGQDIVPQVVNTGVWYTSGYFAYISN